MASIKDLFGRLTKSRANPQLVFRAMRAADDGMPLLGETSRCLGARHVDIPSDATGKVAGGLGGMSVSPNTPAHIAEDRRPRELGGRGKDPAWALDLRLLDSRLRYRPDPDHPKRHGFIEPSRTMSFEEFQEVLAATRPHWALYEGDDGAS